MRGRSLHIQALVVASVSASAIAAMLALGPSPSAVAASPNAPCNSLSAQVVSCHFSNPFTDPDFCGTGKAVDGTFDGRFTVPLVPKGRVGSWNNSEAHEVLTDSATGATVLIHSAYRFTSTLISRDPSGVHTVQAVFKGDAETIRDSHGGVPSGSATNAILSPGSGVSRSSVRARACRGASRPSGRPPPPHARGRRRGRRLSRAYGRHRREAPILDRPKRSSGGRPRAVRAARRSAQP
jgi:hypothetical protein